MTKTLLTLWCYVALLVASPISLTVPSAFAMQFVPFPGPGRAGISGGSVSQVSHSQYLSCANGTNTYTCGITGKVIAGTGNTYVVLVSWCSNVSCTLDPSSVITAQGIADGTNTYQQSTACSVSAASGVMIQNSCFYAKNVTAGTYTVTVSITQSGGAVHYVEVIFVELAGASTSAPEDTNVSVAGTGTSATPSITSPGNVAVSGEGALCLINSDNVPTLSGSFSGTSIETVTGGFNKALGFLAGPTSGATLTCSATQTSGQYYASLISFKP